MLNTQLGAIVSKVQHMVIDNTMHGGGYLFVTKYGDQFKCSNEEYSLEDAFSYYQDRASKPVTFKQFKMLVPYWTKQMERVEL